MLALTVRLRYSERETPFIFFPGKGREGGGGGQGGGEAVDNIQKSQLEGAGLEYYVMSSNTKLSS